MIKEKLGFNRSSPPKEETLSTQQTVLLDELNTRLSETQTALERKSKTIQQQEANRIVANHVLTGSAIGLMPLPIVDIVALSSNQLTMLHRLTRHYYIDFNNNKGKVVLMALLSGSLPTLTMVGLSSSAKLLPGIGTLGGNASLSILGGAITYATGQSFVKHFNAGGTLYDFQAKNFSQFFRQELKKGRQLMRRSKAKK